MASLTSLGRPAPCPEHIEKALQHAFLDKNRLLDEDSNPTAYFMNFTRFERNAKRLFDAFSVLKTTKTTHTFAGQVEPFGRGAEEGMPAEPGRGVCFHC